VLLLGVLGLVLGVWAGLVRIGWRWPVPVPDLPALHGPLMVSGFVGTLIGVERAIGLGQRWAYAAPLLTGVGSLALLVPVAAPYAPYAVLAGSIVFLAVLAVLAPRMPRAAAGALLLSAVLWVAANALWLHGLAIARLVPWWLGFLVLLIAGERRELSRVRSLTVASRAGFVAAVALLAAGIAATLWDFDVGTRVAGLGLVAVAMWLLTQDVAQHTVAGTGLARFMAAGLLAGYVWLGIAGIAAVHVGGVAAGPGYDFVLHAVFLGFVFSMIFAHAPIIFPAVFGRPIAYTPAFYVPLVLLQGSLALRAAGDGFALPMGREWGGLLNGIAIVLFFAVTAAAMRRA
jgi:hypothetical protein